MLLSTGARLGPYEILSPLGAGGMGEVYRARDTRLERTVAVKVLPAHSADTASKQRFEREARVISGLNHPHICVLHDVGHQDGIDYLVMECIEGETLSKRLEKGALPLDQVLRYGVQISDALDRAHRSGVVHRDLKPGNIMITASGVKILDFGLAKSMAAGTAASPLTAPVTQTAPVTERGTILGTFRYMSPEQLQGKDLDQRSDMFSLGAVLYEMLTGRYAFRGTGQLSVVSAILEAEPEPIGVVRPMTPPALDHAIRCCLAKDPDARWQTSRDLALELNWIAKESGQIGTPGVGQSQWNKRERSLLAVVITVVVLAVGLGIFAWTHSPGEDRVIRSYIRPMANSNFILSAAPGFALSPDGRYLAYVASTPDGNAALWLRAIDSLKAKSLEGSEGARYPFWSPDNRFIGFFAAGKLKKINSLGGPPLSICDASDGRGGTWNRDGDILFAPTVNSPIYRVSASGGPATQVTVHDTSMNETTHRWPQFLPDGRHFIYLAGSVFTPRENASNTIKVGSIDSKESKVLIHAHDGAIYASGRILFLRQFSLMAQPFDAKKLELTGEAVPIAEQVREEASVARGWFSASETGLLTYVEGMSGADRRLVWFDRSGKQVGEVPAADAYAGVNISPDGKRLTYYLDSSGFDIWSFDIVRGVKRPLTFGTASGSGSLYPVWSPDGRRIAFTSYRNGKYGLYQMASDGSGAEELLLEGTSMIRFASSWSPDGRFLAYHEGASGGNYHERSPGGWAIWMLPLDGERKPYPFLKSGSSERVASFSPDGKWVAYCSNESGEYKVYVVPFRGPGGKWQVSPVGGNDPRWRRDGKELFYLSLDNKLTAAEVNAAGSSFEVGSVHTLFETQTYGIFARYDVTADGQRFVVSYEAGQPTTAITLVVNWPAELKGMAGR